jgi:hypothetical protein
MFVKGNKYGSKGKRGKGRVDQELKDQLRDITQEVLDSINVMDLTRTQKIQFLKSSLGYLLPKEYVQDVSVNEDLPLFIEDKPVVIAFNSSDEREAYMKADEQRKAEMEQDLRVDLWSSNKEKKGFEA